MKDFDDTFQLAMLFGNNSANRVIDFLMINRDNAFCIKEVSRYCKSSNGQVGIRIKILKDLGVVESTDRPAGKNTSTNFYIVSKQNKLTDLLCQLYDHLRSGDFENNEPLDENWETPEVQPRLFETAHQYPRALSAEERPDGAKVEQSGPGEKLPLIDPRNFGYTLYCKTDNHVQSGPKIDLDETKKGLRTSAENGVLEPGKEYYLVQLMPIMKIKFNQILFDVM